jgi:uncharacterized protein (DUF488 family)
MAYPFHTIGHSTRSHDELVDLLRGAEIALLVDVRTVPRSRRNAQFNRDALPLSLVPFQIGYEHLPELGGLRGRQNDVPASVNGYWQNESFHNYADYAISAAFRAGLDRLRELGHGRRSAVMCAEALWWQCHRRIITDYLLAAGEEVFHIVGPGKVEAARLTEGAKVQPDGVVTYPALL